MDTCPGITEDTLDLPGQSVFFRRLDGESNERPLLLLHGAGVAGELTWGPMLRWLKPRSSILIPDLRGAGETHDPDGAEQRFTATEVVDDIVALLGDQGIDQVDVAGYSFGGLMAMLLKQRLGARIGYQTLLEPGLLERADLHEMRDARSGYQQAANAIRGGEPAAGIRQFLDNIAPHRSRTPRTEELITARLGRRPLGFANALDCVTDAIITLDRDRLLDAQDNVTSLVGGKSPETLKSYHHWLAAHYNQWDTLEISGTDHSLPFQKPRRIAAIIDRQ